MCCGPSGPQSLKRLRVLQINSACRVGGEGVLAPSKQAGRKACRTLAPLLEIQLLLNAARRKGVYALFVRYSLPPA